MITKENLKAYSNPIVHSEIEKLTIEQIQRIKKFIDELINQTNRDFEISDLKFENLSSLSHILSIERDSPADPRAMYRK